MSPVTFPVIVTSGLLDGLNPCAFGVLLSFVAVILGSVALAEDPRSRIWRAGGVYVAGMFLAYLLLGLGLIATVSLFTTTHLPIRLMGFVIVAMGLWTLKDVVLPGIGATLAMPAGWHGQIRQALTRTTPVGLFTAGALVGLCTLPCSGAIYMGVLALIVREPVAVRLPYLVLYNVMFVAPLLAVLAIVGSRRMLNAITHTYHHRKRAVKAVLGAVTVVLGLVILITA